MNQVNDPHPLFCVLSSGFKVLKMYVLESFNIIGEIMNLITTVISPLLPTANQLSSTAR